jgi:hypothetical protein
MTPTTTASSTARIIAPTIIRAVTPSRLNSSGRTGWPSMLLPKLPCSTPVSQCQYRSGIGRSIPNSCFFASKNAWDGGGCLVR